jgi:flavin-dependent dehydrogenase
VVKKIQSICETPFYVDIHTDSGCFRASYLIGADGANSVVRRCVSTVRFYEKQWAIEADVMVNRPDTYQMEFDFSRLHNCYYWLFPKDDHVNIGIYSIAANVKPRVQRLIDFAASRRLANRLEAVKGYPICTGGFNYRPDSKRILLAGDAAGLAERLLGEGIFFAVKSGQQAARSILESEQCAVSVRDLYLGKLKPIQMDLKAYELSSKWFYRFPRVSLKAVSFPFIRNRFVKGYADGKTLTQILMTKG